MKKSFEKSHAELIVPNQYYEKLIRQGRSDIAQLKEEFGIEVRVLKWIAKITIIAHNAIEFSKGSQLQKLRNFFLTSGRCTSVYKEQAILNHQPLRLGNHECHPIYLRFRPLDSSLHGKHFYFPILILKAHHCGSHLN